MQRSCKLINIINSLLQYQKYIIMTFICFTPMHEIIINKPGDNRRNISDRYSEATDRNIGVLIMGLE